MALPNDKKALQDRLTRVATRMAQKFGAIGWTGGGGTGGIPISVLQNRIAGKKIILDNLGNENANAFSFSLVNLGLGITATTNDQLIVRNDASLPNGLYGSATPLVMLARLKAGLDSVDIHVIGDSNGMSPGAYGYSKGLARGLVNGTSAGMYATSLHLPGASRGFSGSPNASLFALAGYRQGGTLNMVGRAEQVGHTLDEIYNAPEQIRSWWDTRNSFVGFGYDFQDVTLGDQQDYKPTPIWLPGEGRTFAYNDVNEIYEFRPGNSSNGMGFGLDTGSTLSYRIVHTLLPGNGASAAQLVAWIGGLSAGYCGSSGIANNLFSGYSVATHGATYFPDCSSTANRGGTLSAFAGLNGVTGITVSKLVWKSDSTRYGVTIGYNWNNTQATFTRRATGPFAVYLESVHCNKKGWAITPVHGDGGATTGGLAERFAAWATQSSNGNSGLKTVFEETRNRQIEAGGSGNVIVFLTSGVNDVSQVGESTAVSVYGNHLSRMILTCKQAWDSLGYPENDLAFVITVTQPTQDGDTNLDQMRVSGVAYSTTPSDNNTVSPYSNVLFVDITKLGLNGITFGGLSAGNSFSGGTNMIANDGLTVHLVAGDTGGYAYVGELLVRRCLEYSDIAY